MSRLKKIARHALNESPAYRICRQKDLARLLRLEERELKTLIDEPTYSVKDITTAKGKTRHTETPVKRLRSAHERLTRLLMQIEPPEYLYCPVKARSQIDNAARHRGARMVWTLDLKDYFPSTPSRRVYWFFNTVMKCTTDVSAVIAKLATREGHLPTGSPLSPILAYYSFYDMWNALAQVARENGCTITVYMDDITVSGSSVSGELTWRIKQGIHSAGLRYHKERTFVDEPALITGVIVDGEKLLLPYQQHLKAHDTRQLLSKAESDIDINRLNNRLRGLSGHRNQIRLAAVRT